jgi:hypothetical protein
MPKETDGARLALLYRLFSNPPYVRLEARAFVGSAEPDDRGLDGLLPANLTDPEKKRRLLDALARFIHGGGAPNRVDVAGTDELDPELRYEFRLRFASEQVYVKTVFADDDPKDPILIVKSVKKRN